MPLSNFPVLLSVQNLPRMHAKARRWVLRKGRREQGIEYGFLVGVRAGAKPMSYWRKFRGDKGRVDIPRGPISIDVATRSVLVHFHHNHPSCQSLSSGDFERLFQVRAFEALWAHGNDGSMFRASLIAFSPSGMIATQDMMGRMFDMAYGQARTEAPPPDPRLKELYFFVPRIVALVLHERGIIEFAQARTMSHELRWRPHAGMLRSMINEVRQVF